MISQKTKPGTHERLFEQKNHIKHLLKFHRDGTRKRRIEQLRMESMKFERSVLRNIITLNSPSEMALDMDRKERNGIRMERKKKLKKIDYFKDIDLPEIPLSTSKQTNRTEVLNFLPDITPKFPKKKNKKTKNPQITEITEYKSCGKEILADFIVNKKKLSRSLSEKLHYSPYKFIEVFSKKMVTSVQKLKHIRQTLSNGIHRVKRLENQLEVNVNEKDEVLELNKLLRDQTEQLQFTVIEIEKENEDLSDKIKKFKIFLREKDNMLINTLKREEIEIEKLTGAIGNLKYLEKRKKEVLSDLFIEALKSHVDSKQLVKVFKRVTDEFEVLKPKRFRTGKTRRLNVMDNKKENEFFYTYVDTLIANVRRSMKSITSGKKKQYHQFRREVLENHNYIIAQNEMLLKMCVDPDKLDQFRPKTVTLNDVMNYLYQCEESEDEIEAKSNLEAVYTRVLEILNKAFDFSAGKKAIFNEMKANIKYLRAESEEIRFSLKNPSFIKKINFQFFFDYFNQMKVQMAEEAKIEFDRIKLESEKAIEKAILEEKEKNKVIVDQLNAKIQQLKDEAIGEEMVLALKKEIKGYQKKMDYLIRNREESEQKYLKLKEEFDKLQGDIDYRNGLSKSKGKMKTSEIEKLKEEIDEMNNEMNEMEMKFILEKKELSNKIIEKDHLLEEREEKIKVLENNVQKSLNIRKELQESVIEANLNSAQKERQIRTMAINVPIKVIKNKNKRNKITQTKPLIEVIRNGNDLKEILKEHKKLLNEVGGMRVDVIVQTENGKCKNASTQTKKKNKNKKKIKKRSELKQWENKDVNVTKSDINPKVEFIVDVDVNVDVNNKKKKKKKYSIDIEKQRREFSKIKNLRNKVESLKETIKNINKAKEKTNITTQTEFSYTKNNVFQFLNQMNQEKEEELNKDKDKLALHNLRSLNYSKYKKSEIKDIIKYLMKKYESKRKKLRKNREGKYSFENYNNVKEDPTVEKIVSYRNGVKKYEELLKGKGRKRKSTHNENETLKKNKEKEKDEENKKRVTLPALFDINNIMGKKLRKKRRNENRKKMKTLMILARSSNNRKIKELLKKRKGQRRPSAISNFL